MKEQSKRQGLVVSFLVAYLRKSKDDPVDWVERWTERCKVEGRDFQGSAGSGSVRYLWSVLVLSPRPMGNVT